MLLTNLEALYDERSKFKTLVYHALSSLSVFLRKKKNDIEFTITNLTDCSHANLHSQCIAQKKKRKKGINHEESEKSKVSPQG